MTDPKPHLVPRPTTAMFARRVRDVMAPAPLAVAPGTPAREAVAVMAGAGASAVLILDGDGRIAGIVTEQDVTCRLAFNEAGRGAIDAVATAPVATVSAEERLYRAVGRMRRLRLRHLPVVDPAGRPVGMLNLVDAMAMAAAPVMRRIDRLSAEASIDGFAELKRAQVRVASDLLDDNQDAPHIQAFITEINHDIHRSLLEDGIRAMADGGWGAPPVPFTLLVMGSGGRGENFLFPDQDNGLILADYPDPDHQRIDAWFVSLAERFNLALDQVGFPLCKGHVMARNPLWRKTATQWRDQIEIWARRRSPVAVLFADIFFDFAPVWGPSAPAEQLRTQVGEILRAQPGLLAAMCEDETNKTVAVGFFGRLVKDSTGESPGRVDLKLHGTMPLVASARLLALRESVAETGTIGRIAALQEAGKMSADDADELIQSYGAVTQCLLRQQLEDFKAERKVGNFVDTDALSRLDRERLVQSLKAIDRFRKRVRGDILGRML